MKRYTVYSNSICEPPGATIHALRTAKQWSQRELAEKCRPPLSHATVSRIEKNEAFTSDSIARVARALGVPPYELFWPEEVKEVMGLAAESRTFVLNVALEALKVAKKVVK